MTIFSQIEKRGKRVSELESFSLVLYFIFFRSPLFSFFPPYLGGKGSAFCPYTLEEFGFEKEHLEAFFSRYRKERGY